MADIDNRTGVPHFWFEQSGPEGEPLDVLVIRGTFDFARDGERMPLSPEQQPVQLGDTFAGPVDTDPYRSVLASDGDLLPYKPGTDVLVFGDACSPRGVPHASWEASVRVGPLRKSLRIHGPRQFRKTAFGWRLGKAAPVTRVPLDYRLAYGGCMDIPAELTGDGERHYLKHAGNPAGCGWLPSPAACREFSSTAQDYIGRFIKSLDTLSAPQIEAAESPVRDPFQDCAAHGLGPVARWTSPRITYQGTFNDEWRNTRYPLLPHDFNTKYYQSADAELIAKPHLSGNEPITLCGLLQQPHSMRLPGWQIVAVVVRKSGRATVCVPLLDTVRIDLRTETTSLVWRAVFDRADPVAEVTIGATSLPDYQEPGPSVVHHEVANGL